MKWIGMGRGFKVVVASLAVGLGMTACSRDYVAAYLYATSATRTTTGEINAYAVDYQTGALTQLADSPIPSGGSNPVTLVAAPNAKFLYVINHDTSSVVEFSIGTDGKLYAQNTYNVVQGTGSTAGVNGSFPTAAAIDPSGKFLYVTFTFQNGFTTATPGPGGVAVFPINADNTLAAAVINTSVGTTAARPLPYFPVGDNPSGIVVSPKGGFVYVIDQEKPTTGSAFGVLLAFTQNATTGALTPQTGPLLGGYAVGTTPSSIAEDPTGRYIYVTDQTTNQLYGFLVLNAGTAGSPAVQAMNSSPFNTGQFPLSVTIDPRGEYVYTANFGSSTVGSYVINQSNGSLSGTASGGTQVDTGPTCVTIDPALGIYLYTSNNTDNSVSGAQLSPNTGALTLVQGTPFTTQPLPTCAVAVANGAHATQIVE